jgi:hypothetical protein
MTVTFARSAGGLSTGPVEAGAPSGSGGTLVVIAAGRFNGATEVAPATPSDWTPLLDSAAIDDLTGQEADIFGAWASVVSAPDMTFGPDGEAVVGLYTFRIADAASSPSVRAAHVYVTTVSSTNLPEVTTAPDGDAVGLITHQGDNTTSSTSLGWTEQYEGDIGGEGGWWAATCTAISLEGVTPGGGTFDAGTATFGSSVNDLKAVVIVVETAGGATVPEAVDDLAGTAGDEQVVLTWTAPDDGGDTIVDYVVQYRVRP